MTSTLGIILATAVVTSLLTVTLIALFAVKWLLPKIQQSRGEIMNEFRQNVRDGALDAGTDLLPKFREQVKKGFEDAIRGTTTGQMMEGARSVAKGGAGIFEEGLSTLLGKREK